MAVRCHHDWHAQTGAPECIWPDQRLRSRSEIPAHQAIHWFQWDHHPGTSNPPLGLKRCLVGHDQQPVTMQTRNAAITCSFIVDTSACEKCLIARLTSLKHRTVSTFFLPRGPAAGGAFGPELPDTGCTRRAACQNFRTFTTK